ncbi:MAG: glycosyltransferase family 4 protein [Bacteroidaceae bacterium]|nr:glycosyltransferase family 4 protein [Bacteroidaceae bacterium]
MKILFIAPLPPPVHGSSMVSKYIKESTLIQESFDCDFVNLSTSRTMEEIGKGGIKKLFRFVAAYFEVLWKLITHRYSLCYLAITCHGMGFLKDAPFVLLCKLFGRKVVLHQHNKGMSRDVNRWPYRWLMPLVYRNTTVMLLSWHLYEDISAVVKREQVVVCANGVPPLDNGQQTTDNSQLSTDGLFNQHDKHTNLDALTHTQACAGHPDEGFGLTQKSQNTQKNIVSQDKQSTLDENSQNLQVASPLLASGMGRHREAQFSSSLSSSLEPSVPRLLFLSNLIESKGIYVLLEACRMLKEEGIVFQCDYVGGESKLISGEAFRSAIAERGLTDCVTYHGPQYGAAKDRFFREADIFVQPTSDDCFPLTLVEAMQYRLPIVSTDVGAIPDIVTDGVNGFVCPQRDVQALAEALRKLIAEPQMRVAMGQRGYELYRERMTLEVFEMRFTGLLKGIVGNG